MTQFGVPQFGEADGANGRKSGMPSFELEIVGALLQFPDTQSTVALEPDGYEELGAQLPVEQEAFSGDDTEPV